MRAEAGAARVIAFCFLQYRPIPENDKLMIRPDRGPSMKSQPVVLLLGTLGGVPSHVRPYLSDDNPFSEAEFKTIKYRPDFPGPFEAYENAEQRAEVLPAAYVAHPERSAPGVPVQRPLELLTLRMPWGL